MQRRKIGTVAARIALVALFGTAAHAMAQDATTPYPNMAPIDQYLMQADGTRGDVLHAFKTEPFERSRPSLATTPDVFRFTSGPRSMGSRSAGLPDRRL